jgi:hypothetical protein
MLQIVTFINDLRQYRDSVDVQVEGIINGFLEVIVLIEGEELLAT